MKKHLGLFIFFTLLILGTNSYAEVYTAITGKVIAEDTGEGIEGVLVNARKGVDGLQKTAYTKKDGTYVIEDLASGEYLLSFTKQHSRFINELYALRVILPKGKNLTNVNYVMEVGGAIEGHVLNAESKSPISNIEVSAWNKELFSSGKYLSVFYYTDSDGHYFLQGLPKKAHYEIYIQVPGHAIMSKSIEVSKGQLVESVDFIVDWNNTGISGKVISLPEGQPIKSAEILIGSTDDKVVGIASTDENGNYSIVGLESGIYNVVVVGPKGGSDEKNLIKIETDKLTIINFEIGQTDRISRLKGYLDIFSSFFFVNEAIAATPQKLEPGFFPVMASCGLNKTKEILKKVKLVLNKVELHALDKTLKKDKQIDESIFYLITNETKSDHVKIFCDKDENSIRCTKCGNTFIEANEITLCHKGLKADLTECGCLATTIFHEMLHVSSTEACMLDKSRENTIYNCQGALFYYPNSPQDCNPFYGNGKKCTCCKDCS